MRCPGPTCYFGGRHVFILRTLWFQNHHSPTPTLPQPRRCHVVEVWRDGQTVLLGHYKVYTHTHTRNDIYHMFAQTRESGGHRFSTIMQHQVPYRSPMGCGAREMFLERIQFRFNLVNSGHASPATESTRTTILLRLPRFEAIYHGDLRLKVVLIFSGFIVEMDLDSLYSSGSKMKDLIPQSASTFRGFTVHWPVVQARLFTRARSHESKKPGDVKRHSWTDSGHN